MHLAGSPASAPDPSEPPERAARYNIKKEDGARRGGGGGGGGSGGGGGGGVDVRVDVPVQGWKRDAEWLESARLE